MEVSSKSPRVPPQDRVGDLPVFCAHGVGHLPFIFARAWGRAFAIHLCPGVGAFAIDVNSRNF